MRNCTVDMGLSKADVQAIYDAWRLTISTARQAIVSAGAYNYQMFATAATPTSSAECSAYLNKACAGSADEASWQSEVALRYELTKRTAPPTSAAEIATIVRDVATFLLVRGDFAWIGHGWIGCVNGATEPNATRYMRPAALDADYGEPVDGGCVETAAGSHIFSRRYTKATITVDCNALEGRLDMK
jgi:hypothetical protein